jgi:protocatechuate 3,4-dioxygenase beta subunit
MTGPRRPELDRRRALTLLAGVGAGVVTLAGCSVFGDDDSAASDSAGGKGQGADSGTGRATSSTSGSTSGSASASASTAANGDGSCATIPEETAGPYPGDGSNGVDALGEKGIVRADIRRSFGDHSGVAEGVPLTIRLTVVDTNNGCRPLPRAAVYVWHCDRGGEYSLYTDESQNYLRGVQPTDARGVVSFTSIYPGAYAGRWPHIHFEVYPTVADATKASRKLATSQLALPEAACRDAYKADGYGESVRNLDGISLATDNVFGDGYSHQLATVTGNRKVGFVANLTIPV